MTIPVEKYVELHWRNLKYERKIKRAAVFGAGKHTVWLSSLLQTSDGPKVIAVLDDMPRSRDVSFGNKPVLARNFDIGKIDAIILSSDCMQEKMRQRCRKLYGDDIPLIDLYEGLPPGPYDKDVRSVVAIQDVREMIGLHRIATRIKPRQKSQQSANGKKTSRPLVSVIVPIYNKQEDLPLRLDTIFNQTYPNIEVAILDNASEDDSLRIVREYIRRYKTKVQIKTTFNKINNQNVFKQWKKGLGMTSGNFVWIAEADDLSHVEFLNRAMAVFAKHDNIGVVYCQSHFVDEHNRVFGNHINDLRHLDNKLWTRDFICEGRKFLSKYMAVMNVIPNASGVVFRRALADSLDWEAVYRYRVCGDWRVWAEMLNYGNIGFVADSMNYFRFNSKTMRTEVHHTAQYLHENMDVHKYIFDKVKPNSQTRKKAFAYFREKVKKTNARNGVELKLNIISLVEKQYAVWGNPSITL